MDRRSFAKLSAASLVCAPSLISAQPPRHVTIIGAGAAGLTAAYHLTKAGVQVQILEAAQSWGGRLKRLTGFADVPLDLGAEWIHDEPDVLGRILGQGETDLGVATISYQPQTYQFWNNGSLKNLNALRHSYKETKFFDTTWYGFFEKFVLPTVRDKISFGAAVSRISKQGARISLRLIDGRRVETEKLLVTAPLSALQLGQISFDKSLAPPRLRALKDIGFGAGFKTFLKFRERFYPDILFFGPRTGFLADTWAEKIYYDAAFGKPTQQNILGLFAVSDEPMRRVSLNNTALLQDVLAELTGIFGSIVEQTYIDGVVQNWSREPFVMGSYSMENSGRTDITEILAPVGGRLFFAGEALGQADQSTVQGAAFSAAQAVEQIMAA